MGLARGCGPEENNNGPDRPASAATHNSQNEPNWMKSSQIVELDDSPVRPNLIGRAQHYRVGIFRVTRTKWQPIHIAAASPQGAPARTTGVAF
jgi:hypothetical protein